MKRLIFIALLLLFSAIGFSQSEKGVWDVFTFGAKGDGKTSDTRAIQTAVDDCSRAGGGKVWLHNSQFLSGTIRLKSNVTIHIESGASLSASVSPNDFPITESQYPSTSGKYTSDKALLYAEGAENIAVTGNGIINGRGDDWDKNERPRPHIIHFRACKGVKVSGVKLYQGASWVQKYQLCDDLLIDGVTVDSRENKDIEKPRYADVPGRNTDGCNIVDCSNVRIANCFITSGDDGIVFKSFSRKAGCYNVNVTNCVISTNAAGIKIGTESAGAFKDFTINNCVVYDTRGAGIGLMTVDGAVIEQVIVSNITLRNIKGAAIFVRLGNRGKVYMKDEKAAIGTLKDVLIQNVYGTGIERYGCSVTGIPAAAPENLTFDNIRLTFTGGNTPFGFEGYPDKPVKVLTIDDVPEREDAYPRCEMFGKLPAYGFYVRHAKGVRFNNIKLDFADEEKRPALIADDVQELFVDNFWAKGMPQTPSLMHFRNVRQATVSNSGTWDEVPVFLQISGAQTKDIRMFANQLKAVKKKVSAENASLLKQVEEINN